MNFSKLWWPNYAFNTGTGKLDQIKNSKVALVKSLNNHLFCMNCAFTVPRLRNLARSNTVYARLGDRWVHTGTKPWFHRNEIWIC